MASDAFISACSEPAANQSAAADAQPEFALRELAPGVFSGWHAAMALRTTFARGSARVVAETGVLLTDGVTREPGAIDLSATAWGCEHEMVEVPGAEPVREAGEKVAYRHRGFDEWYTLGESGQPRRG